MQFLQRVRIVEVPAWTAPGGRHVNHGNQPLVEDVRVELVGVSVKVGDIEIRGCAKLGRSSQRRHAKRQREQKVLHVFVFVFGLITGIFDFMSDHQISQYTLFGVGIVSFLFLGLGANLRHSHVKLKYPSFLERIFISPYQHQIHHSRDPKHHNKNMGGKFALWDWFFGRLRH